MSDGEATVTGFSGEITEALVIPSSLGGYPVTAISNSAFEYQWDMPSVVVPEGVRTIGSRAFRNCYALEEITVEHCRKIGEFLAKIHNIEKKAQSYNRSEINVDWDMLIEKLSENNIELYKLLNANRNTLYDSQQKGNLAVKKMPPVLTICHNDMDSKNVLWNGDECRIIDLECLCYSSPFVELYEMALCWSGYENCNIDFKLFKALIKSYADNGGELPNDWETIYYSSYGRLEWIEYNVKRALGIDCGEDEIETGVSEVRETMEHIVYYHSVKDKILKCLNLL